MTGLCILCKFYLCKFHPSICSPIQTTVLKTTSKCLTIEILLWDSLSHPIFPSGASELLVATSLVPTDGSRGSTRNVGNSCSSTCSHLNSVGAAKGEALGGATAAPKPSCIPRTEAAPICQLQHGEHNQDPKRTRAQMEHLPSSRTSMTWETPGFFSKRQLTYCSLLLNLCPEQCPH